MWFPWLLLSEVDAHDGTTDAGPADDVHSGRREDRLGADVDLVPRDLAGLRPHRVGLDCPRSTGSSVLDRGGGERVGDAALPVARADEDACHGPDAAVRLVLGPALPRRAVDAK